jgi:hypothetical protein
MGSGIICCAPGQLASTAPLGHAFSQDPPSSVPVALSSLHGSGDGLAQVRHLQFVPIPEDPQGTSWF